MTFKPGVSGNPDGARKKKQIRNRLAKDLLGPNVKRAVERVAELLESDDSSDVKWACDTVFHYVFGKPDQQINLADADGNKLQLDVNLIKQIVVLPPKQEQQIVIDATPKLIEAHDAES